MIYPLRAKIKQNILKSAPEHSIQPSSPCRHQPHTPSSSASQQSRMSCLVCSPLLTTSMVTRTLHGQILLSVRSNSEETLNRVLAVSDQQIWILGPVAGLPNVGLNNPAIFLDWVITRVHALSCNNLFFRSTIHLCDRSNSRYKSYAQGPAINLCQLWLFGVLPLCN